MSLIHTVREEKTHRPENIKECGRKLRAHLTSTGCKHPKRERESPPSDVERKSSAGGDGGRGKEEPDQSERPENQCSQESERVERGAGGLLESVCLGEDIAGALAQLHHPGDNSLA